MIENRIKKNISLASFTTFKIGGFAEYFFEVEKREDLGEIVTWAKEKDVRVSFVGGGSNILVNDEGVLGLVVKINNKEIAARGERIECGAGADLAKVVATAASRGLSGLEWASGIPGTVGGAVRGNAGAFGYSMSRAVETLETFDIRERKIKVLSNRDCAFSYRESLFKKDSFLIILSVMLKFVRDDSALIKSVSEEYLKKRLSSQPRLPSAGCVFKNIRIDDLKKNNHELADKAEKMGVVKNGMIASGWLIDSLDLKGMTIGGAKISLEHANFIVNTGGAKASEVIALISYVKQQMRDKRKIQLEEEIEYLGF